ncbi:MAG: hypothetical protein ING73_04855 [Rhodocyclaceae bacterium]|jgi:hypothetical protein|nr:hypothetical protein [Rhodocyclaceae bacterium]MCA3023666.1 hypothetical protein [Rhodocyclaceae bacterium]MCA3030321.1 hypothetical protein [Rhodocyclaceae bacterium]MCA3035653.1 hypothetical protein [Rhodocyclaceae bacterium]MCA3045557.1 hypothetical protein [Rhodocyclaceae bacterium]
MYELNAIAATFVGTVSAIVFALFCAHYLRRPEHRLGAFGMGVMGGFAGSIQGLFLQYMFGYGAVVSWLLVLVSSLAFTAVALRHLFARKL